MQRGGRRLTGFFVVTLLAIGGAALSWRLAYVLATRGDLVGGDGFHYHFGARYLVDGLGFLNPYARELYGREIPDAVHPPGWTIVLAGPTWLGMRTWLWHQVFACLVGASTVLMVGVATRQVFGRRAALIAAGLAAVYANFWLYERELLSEPLAMLGVATIIWVAYRFASSPTLALAVALGVLVAALAFTRAELVALGALLVAPLVLSRPIPLTRRLTLLASAGATCIALIAPWAAYNSTRMARPVPLSAGLGAAMVQGNCAATYYGELLGYAEFACVTLRSDVSMDPSVADSELRDVAIRYMSKHKSRIPIAVAARLGRTFNIYRPFQQVHLEAHRGTAPGVLRLALFQYWILVPFAIAGAFVARRRQIRIWPILVAPALVVLAVVPTLGTVRYRAVGEVALVMLAALAIDATVCSVRNRSAHAPPEHRFGRDAELQRV